ncbi:50S ribosomal protein L21 [Nitzschia inconspicua]|uniref:Large ribosomal subunit protein bL21m n=1 Tax=Nitzschia inconspicua TaxID=303405 RepID=A0A9K3KLT8_9STRA|nr:50S ribosomal protein L21 [Nitzschia inconspicua]
MRMASIVGRRLRTTNSVNGRISGLCDAVSPNNTLPTLTLAADRYYYHSYTTCTFPTHTPFLHKTSIQTGLSNNYKNNSNTRLQQYATSSVANKYAAVDHVEAYEMAMQGRHGQQLALARLEGVGKDDPPFDPFLEDEKLLLQQQQKLEQQQEQSNKELSAKETNAEDDDDDDGYHGDVSEDEDVEDFDDDEDGPLGSKYNPDGSLRRKKSVLATLRAGYPAGGLFAIIELAGAQHKVTTDDLIVVNRLQPVDVFKIGSVHTLQDVMLVGSSHLTLVGMPYVKGAQVDVMVEEITLDAKVIVFKKRRRKNSQRRNGYRRDLTMLRVVDIRMPEEYQNHTYVGRDSVEELDPDRTVVASASISGRTKPASAAAASSTSEPSMQEETVENKDSEIKEQLKTA